MHAQPLISFRARGCSSSPLRHTCRIRLLPARISMNTVYAASIPSVLTTQTWPSITAITMLPLATDPCLARDFRRQMFHHCHHHHTTPSSADVTSNAAARSESGMLGHSRVRRCARRRSASPPSSVKWPLSCQSFSNDALKHSITQMTMIQLAPAFTA